MVLEMVVSTSWRSSGTSWITSISKSLPTNRCNNSHMSKERARSVDLKLEMRTWHPTRFSSDSASYCSPYTARLRNTRPEAAKKTRSRTRPSSSRTSTYIKACSRLMRLSGKSTTLKISLRCFLETKTPFRPRCSHLCKSLSTRLSAMPWRF